MGQTQHPSATDKGRAERPPSGPPAWLVQGILILKVVLLARHGCPWFLQVTFLSASVRLPVVIVRWPLCPTPSRQVFLKEPQTLIIFISRLAERTYEDYEGLLQRYVRAAIGTKKLSDLKPLHIQVIYTDMLERGLSPRVVRYVHAVISNAFKQAKKWGMLGRNPAEGVDLPKQTRKEMRALSPEEAGRFIAAAREDEHGLIFIFALMTGCRPEEYLALQWKDVDLESGVIIIQRTLVWRRKGGGWYYGQPKTAKSRRNIPLASSLVRDLRMHRREQVEARLKLGPKWQDHDLVFTTAVGGPLMGPNLYRRNFTPIVEKAKLSERIRLYDLRHSCATLLLAAGEHPKVVSERLGHSTVVLTLDTYSHVLPSMQKAASKRLESIVLGNAAHQRHTEIEKQSEDRSETVESVVARDGIEPPTRGFSVRCSTI
jgi:integrase